MNESESPQEGAYVDVPVDVRYADTDAQGVVYHANYIVYFEVARGGWLKGRGLRYMDLEDAGTFIVVVEAHCRYRAPARYEDELVVRIWVKELRTRSLTFAYQVRRGESVIADGWTAHVFVDRAGKPVAIPAAWRNAACLGEAATERV